MAEPPPPARDAFRPAFIHPGSLAREQPELLESARGVLVMVSCRSGARLADAVVARYQALLAEAGDAHIPLTLGPADFQFSDSETCARLERDVSGHDAFLFQGLYDPIGGRSVDENLMGLLTASRALREGGANHVTAMVPYLAYSRQDKPTPQFREPTTAKLVADLLTVAGIDRLVTWHPHNEQLHGFFGRVPVDVVDPLSFFVEEFSAYAGRSDVVVVAPDAGASKLAIQLARSLGLMSAIASKFRPFPEQAEIGEIIGDFTGKRVAVVIDDIVSSGGTIEALVKSLVQDKGIEEVVLGISHNLCLERGRERLTELNARFGLRQVVVTDTIPQTEAFTALPFVTVRSIVDILCRVVNRIHHNRSVSELVYRAASPR